MAAAAAAEEEVVAAAVVVVVVVGGGGGGGGVYLQQCTFRSHIHALAVVVITRRHARAFVCVCVYARVCACVRAAVGVSAPRRLPVSQVRQ